jgi:hypothetical protein
VVRRHATGLMLRMLGPVVEIIGIILFLGGRGRRANVLGLPQGVLGLVLIGVGLVMVVVGLGLSMGRRRRREPTDRDADLRL